MSESRERFLELVREKKEREFNIYRQCNMDERYINDKKIKFEKQLEKHMWLEDFDKDEELKYEFMVLNSEFYNKIKNRIKIDSKYEFNIKMYLIENDEEFDYLIESFYERYWDIINEYRRIYN